MRVIIAGSRTITSKLALLTALVKSGFTITEVVCGGASGVDTLGFDWARANSVPVKTILPDWKKHGKAAGQIRNREMGDYAEALIAIWDGKSRGTKGMIDYAKKKGLAVYVALWSPLNPNPS